MPVNCLALAYFTPTPLEITPLVWALGHRSSRDAFGPSSWCSGARVCPVGPDTLALRRACLVDRPWGCTHHFFRNLDSDHCHVRKTRRNINIEFVSISGWPHAIVHHWTYTLIDRAVLRSRVYWLHLGSILEATPAYFYSNALGLFGKDVLTRMSVNVELSTGCQSFLKSRAS